jgi:transitional endoplasmic reticulum ATPase
MPLAEDVDLESLARRTHGFVGADLESLATEAAMAALRRRERNAVLGDLRVTRADFETAIASVEPSAMREYVAEKPTEGFDAVGGLQDVKDALERAVTWPLTYGPLFEAADTTPPSGVLLYGPPGTGKTLLARAIAAESGVNFIHVAGPELLDRYVGESEKSVRELFERARQTAPSIVFFDEIDAIASPRGSGDTEVTERVVSQLLTELDRAVENPSLVVIAATNRRDVLDPALLRPGRFEQHIQVPLPDEAARRAVLGVHTREKPLADDVDLDALAERTAGFSGADIEALCREAAVRAVTAVVEQYDGETANEHTDELIVTMEVFEAAFETVSPSTS